MNKNTTVVFPAPLMSTIQEVGAFLAREAKAVGSLPILSPTEPVPASVNGSSQTAVQS